MPDEAAANSRTGTILTWAAIFIVVACLAFLWRPDSDHSASLKPIADRKPLTNFELATINGNMWRLSDNAGRVVLINFWATWCGPCRQETPALVRLANAYSDKGLQIAGVSLDTTGPETVRRFAVRYGIGYPLLTPTPALASQINSLPTTLLVDRRGNVARVYRGAVSERTLRRDLEQLLAEKL